MLCAGQCLARSDCAGFVIEGLKCVKLEKNRVTFVEISSDSENALTVWASETDLTSGQGTEYLLAYCFLKD